MDELRGAEISQIEGGLQTFLDVPKIMGDFPRGFRAVLFRMAPKLGKQVLPSL